MGTVNLHGSLLPQYRGAAPINWAVINGESITGVTTFKLQHAIDTGNILLQESFPIGDDETAGEVHDRMKTIGARLLVKTVEGLVAGTLTGKPQIDVLREQGIPGGRPIIDPADLKHAPKIVTDTCRIDWNRPVRDIHNLIRGLSPYPTAFTDLDGKVLKIYRSEKEAKSPSVPPGTYDTDGKTYLRWATPDGYVRVTELQLEGKKKMVVSDFLRGYRFAANI
jgi:methionyl-tRNA formyltransferase